MDTYLLEPKYKKSFVEITTYEKMIDGVPYKFNAQAGWRYGSFTVEIPKECKNPITEIGDPEEDINIDDIMYETEFNESFDLCWYEYDLDDLPENIRDELAEYLEEHTVNDLEDEEGWDILENHYEIVGGFKLTKQE
jgi:hypothetical protein